MRGSFVFPALALARLGTGSCRDMSTVYAKGMPTAEQRVGVPSVDLRSDTVTRPTDAQRRAMLQAVVGDDVVGEDPTVNELERRCAQLLGKESALFLPSGTMGNLTAVMAHCWERGCEMIVGRSQHIAKHEQGNFAQFGSISCCTLENEPDGTLDLSMVKAAHRSGADYHAPVTKLLCLENTHNVCGGVPLSMEYMKEARQLCDQLHMSLHVDGARLLNAAVALKRPPSELAAPAHSVQMCLSKGIGAPVGSILVGDTQLVARARRLRKALGGGMRQAGVVAAAALCALDTATDRIKVDHRNATLLAQYINDFHSPHVSADTPRTNVILVRVKKVGWSAEKVCSMLKTAYDKCSVLCYAMDEHTIRLVTHSDVAAQEHIEMARDTFKYVLGLIDAH